MPRPDQFRNRLPGKRAIVTGGGGVVHPDGDNIGSAIAQLLAAEGADVCIIDRDRDRAEHSLGLISAAGGHAFVKTADVRKDDECRAAVHAAKARMGGIDILINSVGIGGGSWQDPFDDAAWQRVFDVNVKGAMLMSRHAVRVMAEQGGGSIVNISSIASMRSSGSVTAYGASKSALEGLSRDIAVSCGRSGVRVNTICPGHMFTPIVGMLNEEQRHQRQQVSPLGIKGDAWDIAFAVLFFASDESRFLTGTCTAVDGGVTVMAPLKGAEFLAQ